MSATIVYVGEQAHRLGLGRELSMLGTGILGVIGVNPADAGEVEGDQSLAKMMGFGNRLGFQRLMVANKFTLQNKDVRAVGRSYSQVASQFRVSKSLIAQIVRKELRA